MTILGMDNPPESEQNTYADIEAAYICLIEKYGVKEEDVILYGQYVGSGPTLDLAIRLPNLRAVVLHSPIMSGLRVMYPVKRTYWFDIYKNIDKIPAVNCPVLVIHPTHLLSGHAGDKPSEAQVEQLVEDAEKYTLANHLFWGLWGIISAYVNNIYFDYKEYARQRLQQYWLRKPALLLPPASVEDPTPNA